MRTCAKVPLLAKSKELVKLKRMSDKLEKKIDDLAAAVKRGFDGVYEQMNERFDGVDNRFEWVDNRLDKVESRLDKVDAKLEIIDRRLDHVVDDHGQRIKRLEKEVEVK